MGIVNWSGEAALAAAEDLKSSEEATMHLLQLSPEQLENRWRGHLVVKPIIKTLPRFGEVADSGISVELRKKLGASVLIKIVDRQSREGNKLVHITLNESARFTEEDLVEMNLAIAEGIEMYRHPAAWIKRNGQPPST